MGGDTLGTPVPVPVPVLDLDEPRPSTEACPDAAFPDRDPEEPGTRTPEEENSPPSSQKDVDRELSREFVHNNLRVFPSMYVEVQGGEEVLPALVDSGADRSLIQASSVPSGAPLLPTTGGIQGLGGYVSLLGEVRLSFTIPGLDIQEVRLRIVPDGAISHPVILAIDFLKANKLSVNESTGIISQKRELGVAAYHLAPGGPTESKVTHCRVPVYLQNDMHLRAQETVKLPVVLHGSTSATYLFEPNSRLAHVELLTGVVTFQHGVTQVLGRTITRKTKGESFKKGTCLGTVSTLSFEPASTQGGEGEDASQDHDHEYHQVLGDIQLPKLTPEEQEKVKRMLWDVREVFSRGDDDVHQAFVTQHHIELQECTPIRQKVRRFPGPDERRSFQ